MRSFTRNLYQSFPVQLLLLHLRSNYLLLSMWVLLALVTNGLLGPRLGLQYLFLDPEYLASTGYWSFLLVGAAYGFFTMSWNLSTYLLIGGYFNFLASLTRPFFKFCINNVLLPLGVLLTYCVRILISHDWVMGIENLSGLIMGLVLSLFLYSIYFNLTNRDIGYYTGYRASAPPNRGPRNVDGEASTPGYQPYRASALGPQMATQYDNPFRVSNYLTDQLSVRVVRSVAHYDSGLLRNIFRQNHSNALIIQFATILVLVLLGLLIDFPHFQLPAGASLLILFSLFVSIIGAISYWFSEWRLALLLLLLLFINFLTSTPFFDHGNQAYGLSYDTTAPYSVPALESIFQRDTLVADLNQTRNVLERWRGRQTSDHPKLVIICASGGGLTAALWSTHVAQSIDECSQGRLLDATALITGASGGMLGMAYLRESYSDSSGLRGNPNLRLDQISSDLLNPVAFSIVSNDIFLPFRRVSIGGQSYRRDRAYAFENAYNQVTDQSLNRPLSTFREAELKARIPMMFLTPSIIEDGRRMVISPLGVSYMMAPPTGDSGEIPLEPDMVDFRRLLKKQEADSIRMSTALRANASYPYVLPQVELPTRPQIHLMDAGYRDNYGIASATRFVKVFREWILENTSGVVLVQISAFREQPIEDRGPRGVISSLFSPVGVAGNILSLQILDQESLLGDLAQTLGPDKFDLFRFNFQPRADDPLRTSVSLHMTAQEKRQVLRALDAADQQTRIDELIRVISE